MANAIEKIKKFNDSNKLPPGHVDRFTAKAALQNEYRCTEIEKLWDKKLKRSEKNIIRRFTEKKAFDFCNQLCEEFHFKPLKKIVFYSKEIIAGAAGHYNPLKKEIHFIANARFPVLIHELTHHFGHHHHDKNFTITLNILFQITYQKFKGKQAKPYWIKQSEQIIEELFQQ